MFFVFTNPFARFLLCLTRFLMVLLQTRKDFVLKVLWRFFQCIMNLFYLILSKCIGFLKKKRCMETRGIRNNNPANIKRGSNWKGLSPVQTDWDFCQFESMEYGVRALACLLRTYFYKYKLKSVKAIISRFCPDYTVKSYIDFLVVFMRRHMKNMAEMDGVTPSQKSIFYTASDSFDENSDMCLFVNRKTPSIYCFFLMVGICWIESRYSLDNVVYERVLILL